MPLNLLVGTEPRRSLGGTMPCATLSDQGLLKAGTDSYEFTNLRIELN